MSSFGGSMKSFLTGQRVNSGEKRLGLEDELKQRKCAPLQSSQQLNLVLMHHRNKSTGDQTKAQLSLIFD